MLTKFKIRFITVIFVFLVLEFYLLLLGTFPIEIETKNINDEFSVQIHKKSAIPPFERKDITIQNAKQAILIISQDDSKSATIYIETETGEKNKFTKLSETDAKKITAKINEAISNKTEFKYTTNREDFVLLGTLYLIVTISMAIPLFIFVKKRIQNGDIPGKEKKDKNTTDYIFFLIQLTLFSSAIIFCVFALYFFFSFRTNFEIKSTNETTIMQFYKKSFMPPYFKEKDLLIENIKSSAVKTKVQNRFETYVLEIINYNDDKTETPVYFYNSKKCKNLSDKINEAISNKTDFSYVEKNEINNIMGFFSLFIAIMEILFLLLFFKKIKALVLKQNNLS